MKIMAKMLVFLAALSILVGIVVKLAGFDFSAMGISVQYPVKPQSFLNFANSVLLFSIALLLMSNQDDE